MTGVTQALLLIIAVAVDVLLLPVELTLELFSALQPDSTGQIPATDILTIAIMALLVNVAIAKTARWLLDNLPG